MDCYLHHLLNGHKNLWTIKNLNSIKISYKKLDYILEEKIINDEEFIFEKIFSLKDILEQSKYYNKINELKIDSDLDKIIKILFNNFSIKEKNMSEKYFFNDLYEVYGDKLIKSLIESWNKIDEVSKITGGIYIYKKVSNHELLKDLYSLLCDVTVSSNTVLNKFELFKVKFILGKKINNDKWKDFLQKNNENASFVNKCNVFLSENGESFNVCKQDTKFYTNQEFKYILKIKQNEISFLNSLINTGSKVDKTIQGIVYLFNNILDDKIKIIKNGMNIEFSMFNEDVYIKFLKEKNKHLEDINKLIGYIDDSFFKNPAILPNMIAKFLNSYIKKSELNDKLNKLENKEKLKQHKI